MSDAPVPSYYRIKMALLDEIKKGAFVPGHSFITEREVCKIFGVSRTTAIRALNELVNDGVLTRQRGRGTFVTGMAGNPDGFRAESGNNLIGCVFHEIHGQHVMEILSGIESVCRETNSHLMLLDSMTSSRTESLNLERALKAGVKGLIVYPVDGFFNLSHFQEIYRARMPFVFVDRYYPSLAADVVLPDSYGAAYKMTSFLIERGHSHIATIWGETSCTSIQEELMGYKMALRDHGLLVEPDLAAQRSYDSLAEEARHALLKRWLAAPYRPTAILAVNSYNLSVVSDDLVNVGVDVSKNIMLASMGNDNPEALARLGASTIVLPSRRLGEDAMRVLLNKIENPEAAARYEVLPVELSGKPGISAGETAAAM